MNTPPVTTASAVAAVPAPTAGADYKAGLANRLKTARGHLDGILRMIDTDAWCPDVMKQLSAVQGILDGASRQVLRHHLETHVATAIAAGDGDGLVDELMETFKYDRGLLWPPPPDPHGQLPEPAQRDTGHPIEAAAWPD